MRHVYAGIVVGALLVGGCAWGVKHPDTNETCYNTTPPLERVHPWFWWLNPFAAIPLYLEGGFDGKTTYCENQ